MPSKIIIDNNIGYCIEPNDYSGFENLLVELSSISEVEFNKLVNNLRLLKKKSFDFDKQIEKLLNYIQC